MMCLRLDEIIKENIQHGNRQSISELLQSHVVHEKPIIQLFGNVTNPDSENVAPARKSKRHCSGSGSLRGTQQEYQENKNKSANQRSSFIRESEVGGLAAATPSRRSSNRSKRGRNTSLANCGYVLYGVEGGRNSSSNKSA